MSQAAQLILPIGIAETRSFGDFEDAANPGLLRYLQRFISLRDAADARAYTAVILWGASGAGKTHLMSAIALRAKQAGLTCAYIQPGRAAQNLSIEGAQRQIYLLDEIEAFIGSAEAEQRLLTLIEIVKQQQALLFISARHAARGMGIKLPDLLSRLQAMDSVEVRVLDESQKREVLRKRALRRGIILSNEVLNWLFTHTSRELSMLMDLLEQMDVRSLSQKRKVTIPLLKAMLAEG